MKSSQNLQQYVVQWNDSIMFHVIPQAKVSPTSSLCSSFYHPNTPIYIQLFSPSTCHGTLLDTFVYGFFLMSAYHISHFSSIDLCIFLYSIPAHLKRRCTVTWLQVNAITQGIIAILHIQNLLNAKWIKFIYTK